MAWTLGCALEMVAPGLSRARMRRQLSRSGISACTCAYIRLGTHTSAGRPTQSPENPAAATPTMENAAPLSVKTLERTCASPPSRWCRESVADHGNRMSAKHAVVGCGERPADGCANT